MMEDHESYNDLIQAIADIQAVLPSGIKQQDRIKISTTPTVKLDFPTRDSAIARFHTTEETSSIDLSEVILKYWQVCEQMQAATSQQYLRVISNLESLEHLGGPSDFTLRSQVARGFSGLYKKCETKLANYILHRYNKLAAKQSVDPARAKRRDAIEILRQAFAISTHPTDAERDYLAKQTGMTYRQVTIWFQNARSRRIIALPKRARQISSRQPLASPPQTASTMESLHEVEQHLRTMTDSPLAQPVALPDRKDPYHQLRLPTPSPLKSTLRTDENNSGMVRSFSGIAEARLAIRDAPRAAGGDVQTRKIKPLRKSRLAGKKAATAAPAASATHDATSLQREQNGLQPSARFPDASAHAQQLNPTDILSRSQDKSRVSSNSSISIVDSLLDGNPSHNQVFRAGPDEVLALPLSALDKRTVSGSSAGQVDESLVPGGAFEVLQSSKMIPMFNFHPPTPSNAGFTPSANAAAQTSNGTHNRDSCETPLTFEPLDLRTIFGPVSDGANHTTDMLSRASSDLDYEEFLTSPGTSAEGSPELVQGSFEAGPSVAEDISLNGAPGSTADSAHIKYIFDQMDAQSKDGDGMDIDPAIFEMLKEILMGGAIEQNGILEATENVHPPPHSTPVAEDASSTSLPLSEYDPSLAALAIDLSGLMGSSTHESLCVQTTPSDVSEMAAFDDREGDAVSLVQRPDVVLGNEADRPLMQNDEKAVDWGGLLDFGDMFDAFWKMVDGKEGDGSLGQSLSHA